jgi:ribosome biogenesis protein Nip4
MQTRKARVNLRRLTNNELNSILEFLRNLKAPGLISLESLVALDIEGGSYSDVFEVTHTILKTLSGLGSVPYTVGFYIGLIDRNTLNFKPSLPLALRACRLCIAGVTECYVLKERDALRFTYGKRVRLYNKRKLATTQELPPVRPVISRRGDCLGWGVLQSRGNVKYLYPLLDLGWYLRRGG